jgi:phosphohistidine phosphatase
MEENRATPVDPAADPDAPQAQYQLYIMRHGESVKRGEASYPDDSKRPLTPQGRKRMQQIAAGLGRMGFRVDWIVSSPLVRAVETAQLLAESLASPVPVEFSDTLGPEGSAEAVIALLATYPDRKRTLLVGHEPGLSELARRLIGAGRQANLTLKKGGCCLITFTEFPPSTPGRLVWWLTPRALRKMA